MNVQQSIYVRALDPSDWQMLKIMRLYALRSDPGVFSMSYEQALARKDEEWKTLVNGQGRQMFGLFDRENLIGMTGILPDLADSSGESGLLVMSFILLDYREKGLSDLLYKARIDWARAQPSLNKICVSHREGNEPSRRAMLKHGFRFIEREMKEWSDGKQEYDCKYELDLEALRS